MPKLLYTVRATCRDIPQRGRYLAWLSPNHIIEVMKGGATSARIVLPLPDDLSHDAGRATDPGLAAASNRVSGQTPAGQLSRSEGCATDPGLAAASNRKAGTAGPPHNDAAPAIVETQYVFPSRKAYDAYIRDHAPALRADGLKHFPPESGVTSERQVAEIAAEL
jgi:hypothetical protein